MANLQVTYDELHRVATQLRAGQEELDTQLRSLRSLVAELVTRGFTTTSASGAFDAAYEEFTTGARNAVQGIERMAHFLTMSADTLQDTDEQLARAIHG